MPRPVIRPSIGVIAPEPFVAAHQLVEIGVALARIAGNERLLPQQVTRAQFGERFVGEQIDSILQHGDQALAVRIQKAEVARPPETLGQDVLQDQAIRQGIKAYSDWPTIPQLYVKGEFIGGSDIIAEMYEAGELEELFA